jgi:hypothetical protein
MFCNASAKRPCYVARVQHTVSTSQRVGNRPGLDITLGNYIRIGLLIIFCANRVFSGKKRAQPSKFSVMARQTAGDRADVPAT